MSCGAGFSTSSERCAASMMVRFPSSAASIALMDISRPTKTGRTMYGKTTMSRIGSSGRRSGISTCAGSFCACSAISVLERESFEIVGEPLSQFGVLQAELDGGLQEAELVSGIVPDAVHEQCMHGRRTRQRAQGVRELDFLVLAGLRLLQHGKDRRRQDVAANDGQP